MINLFQKYLGNQDFGEIITKGFSFFLIRLLSAAIGYIFTIYVSNKYGADIYGLVALGLSMFTILSVIGRLGLETNIVKFFSQDKNDVEAGVFFKSIIISFIFSGCIAYILYFFSDDLVYRVYKEPKPELLDYLPWILAALPFWNVAVICASLLRAKKLSNAFAFITNISRFLLGFILIILITTVFGVNPVYVVLGHFWGVVLTAVISFIMALKRLSFLKIKSKTKSYKFLKESFPMLLSSSILILLGLTDTQVMGIYESNSNIGIYNVSIKIATLTTFSLQAINSILAPKIAKSFAEGNEEYKSLIKFSTKLNFLISAAVVLGIIVFRNFLLGLFGESFLAGEIILLIFCGGQIINSFAGSVGVILQMIGKQRVYQNFVVGALILNLILTFILTPIYGGIGAACATVISMAFWNIGSAIYLKYKMNIITYYNFK